MPVLSLLDAIASLRAVADPDDTRLLAAVAEVERCAVEQPHEIDQPDVFYLDESAGVYRRGNPYQPHPEECAARDVLST